MKPISIAIALLVIPSVALAQENAFTADDEAALSACTVSVLDATGEPPDAPALPRGDTQNPHVLADCIGAASSICMNTPDGSTTIGMSQCMARETDWWDERLNSSYQDLRDTLDAESFTALQSAQKHWIAFRDADCEFLYTRWRDGTIRSTFYASCMLEATATRAITLSGYLNADSY